MKQFIQPSADLIKDVKIKPLKVLVDNRGSLMEILRCDENFYDGFGQVYVTMCRAHAVKTAHMHKNQFDNFCCVSGLAKVVLYDIREDSPTFHMINEIYIGTNVQKVLKIPPFVVHGFLAIGSEDAIIVNMINIPYNRDDPDEYRIDLDEIPYDWFKPAIG